MSIEPFHLKYQRLCIQTLPYCLFRYLFSFANLCSCSSDGKISLFVTTIALFSASIFSIATLFLQPFVVLITQHDDSNSNNNNNYFGAGLWLDWGVYSHSDGFADHLLHDNDTIRNWAISSGIFASVVGSLTIIALICLWPIKLKPFGNKVQKAIYMLLFSIVLFAQIGATVLMLRIRFCKRQGGCKLGIGGIFSAIASTLWSIGTIAIVFTSVPNSKVVPAIPTNNDIEEGER